LNPLWFGLFLYLAVMLAVGVAASRYMKSLDDFVLGGRRLGPWVAAISERASGESSWFLLGLPGAAYGSGFTEFWSVSGIGFGILVSWTFIAIPLRRESARLGALTLPDYFELRFKDKTRLLRIVSMIAILVFYTFYVAAQLHGAGKILKGTFGFDHVTGIWIGAVVVVVYTLLGGFLAVAWTDLIQGLMMTAVAVLLPLVGIIHIGGFDVLVQRLTEQGPGLVQMSGGKIGAAVVFGIAVGGLSWGFGYLGQPHLLTRYMAIRKTSELRKGQLIAMGWVLVSYWGAPLIGMVGLAILGPGLADQEAVMPMVATALLPAWLAGMMIAGATAAMMSTADSQLLVATSTLVEDIYVRLFRPRTTPSKLVMLSRLATLTVAGVALVFALRAGEGASGGIIYSTVSYAWSGLGSSFGPALLLGLWWKRTTYAGALAGMIGGIGSTILWKNWLGGLAVGDGVTLNSLIDIKAATFLFSFALVVVVSLMTRPPEGADAEGTRSS